MKLKKKKIIVISIIVVLFLLLLFFVGKIIADTNRNPYGNRCDERHNVPISDSQLKKVKKKFKEIEQVNDIDVYTKLCTVKIIINLKEDVELDVIKEKAREALSLFSEDELALYDFALFVSSDNKESEVYPINVSKHNSREDFAW